MLFSNEQEKTGALKLVIAILGFITVASTTAYLVYKHFSDKAYSEKWKDYDDCGLA